MLLSLTIFSAAAVGLAAWRTFAPLTESGEPAGPQMLGGRTRAALEREKTLVLRSIKELEFDHAMHKVSDKDFAEMGARLRMRAAGLIRQLDAAASYREQIENEIESRVGRALPGSPGGPRKVRPTASNTTMSNTTASNTCAGCATENDVDARFCKHCGAALGATS